MDERWIFHRKRSLGSWGFALAALLGVTAVGLLPGCGNELLGPGGSGDTVPEPPYISDPVSPPPISAGGIQPKLTVRSAGDSVSYVSFPPETFPGADSARVDNPANGATAGSPLFEGGLDPLPIAASAGDTLQITVWTGLTGEVMFRAVPVKEPIIVVRTKPRRGRTSVPINLSVAIVWSEPAQPASVNPQSVQLLRGGQPVPAALQLRPDGLVLELIPDELLAHETTYTILVTTDVRDLSGDPLAESFQSEFTTAAIAFSDKLVFQSSRSGMPEIYVVDAEGGDPTRFTYEVGGGTAEVPAVSPDGRRIAFSSVVSGPTGPIVEHEIYVLNADGTEPRNLTRHPDFDWKPAWSPDGSRIAFISTRDGNADVWVMDADGSNPSNLTASPQWEGMPAWLPDGSRIAFARDPGLGEAVELYVMNADGREAEKLVAGEFNAFSPSWAPDGSRIVFEGSLELFVANADGSGIVNLLQGAAFPSVSPSWSPDGSRIAFASRQPFGHGIYVVNPDGSGIRQLTAGPDDHPAWSP